MSLYRTALPRHRYVINVKTLEWIVISGLFLLSFLNTSTLLCFVVGITLLLYQKEIGAIKIINIIIFRTIINTGLAIDIGVVQNIKWMVLFACSGYLTLSYFKLPLEKRERIRRIVAFSIIFGIYNFIVAFSYSSLPIVATTKILSYTLIFLGVLIGVAYTSEKFDWLKWMLRWLQWLIVISCVMVLSPTGYLINGVSFQGVINHPNLFGVICCLFLALLIAEANLRKFSVWTFGLMPLAIYLVILSRSRTALIGCVVLLVFLMFRSMKRMTHLKMALLSFAAAGAVFAIPMVMPFLEEFIYKGQTPDEILFSREEQLGTLVSNFQQHPWFGTGFSVPYLQGVTDYSFSMEFIVESGNLILAVLSYSGIVGFLIFSAYMLQVFLASKGNLNSNIYLFLAPFLVSMGEMVFFSSNSIGVFCYMFLALYIFSKSQPDIK